MNVDERRFQERINRQSSRIDAEGDGPTPRYEVLRRKSGDLFFDFFNF